ncbi:protocadherin gamma-B2-like [Pelodytes ibericus]
MVNILHMVTDWSVQCAVYTDCEKNSITHAESLGCLSPTITGFYIILLHFPLDLRDFTSTPLAGFKLLRMVFKKMERMKTEKAVQWQVMCFMLFCFNGAVSGQLHYSVPEETKKDYLVGNIAKDLGLNLRDLALRKFRISSVTAEHLFHVNLQNGNLFVSDRIDRETICEMTVTCLLGFEAVVENPLQVFKVEIEIQDINDNPPVFSKNIVNLELSESTHSGTRFVLGNAIDPDIGINSLQTYKISENPYFKLGQKTSGDGQKYPELILESPLDRERQSAIEIIVTASDGGNPMKTGTAVIKIVVGDINDNAPVFQKDLYQVRMVENTPINSLVLHLTATDSDEGVNGQVTYRFSRITKVGHQVFTLNSQTGELKTKGELDFETTKVYEMTVEAADGGGLVSHCKVVINIVDANDNSPEIILTSVSNSLPEDSPSGTVIALINIRDLDSGGNGDVSCQLAGRLPFELISSSSNYYRLLTTRTLDREEMDFYNITIKATDKGSPPLSTIKTIRLDVSDVNDNPPVFEQTEHVVFVPENKASGSSIYSVQASDPDIHDNSKVIYSIVSKNIEDAPVSSYISINSVTGVLYAQRQFDYEQLREFEIQVMAKDNGSPSQHSNTTVKICITDQNDNPPKILYPSTGVDGSALFEIVPYSSKKGYLVAKVVAVDADSGHNAWLSYQFLQVPEKFDFTIGQHTGEIRTARAFQDKEVLKNKVIVLVKDNGNPPLSSTVTLNLVVAENYQKEVSEMNTPSRNSDSQSNLNIYLVIGLALISFLFTLTVMLAIILRCRKSNHPKSFGSRPVDMYSQVGPVFPTNFSNGTLTLPYKYDVCVALDSTENEFAFIKPSQNVPTDNLIGTNDSGIGIHSLSDFSSTELNTQMPAGYHIFRASESARLEQYTFIPQMDLGSPPTSPFTTCACKTLPKLPPFSGTHFHRSALAHEGLCATISEKEQSSAFALAQILIFVSASSEYHTVCKMLKGIHQVSTPSLCDSTYHSCITRPPKLHPLVSRFAWGQVLGATKIVEGYSTELWEGAEFDVVTLVGEPMLFSPYHCCAQPTEEAGVWPNNQFETERLQAMILASANEAAEGNAALGGGTGTMGLSARYGPQFTLQHVPDYRQNIYIPGTTSTLTNAAGKRDGKAAAPSGGNKKKSGKKEKK